MTTPSQTIVYVLLGSLLVVHGTTARVTPVQRVVDLLTDLSAKISDEGKKEAAEYDKYACFCKEQADQKLYAIEKSNETIASLKADIEDLEAAKAALEVDMNDLLREIDDLTDKIEHKEDKRGREHAKYLEAAQDMNEAIAACRAAIEALKNSKNDMTGAKVNLVEVTSNLVRVVKKHPVLSEAPRTKAFLSQIDGKALKWPGSVHAGSFLQRDSRQSEDPLTSQQLAKDTQDVAEDSADAVDAVLDNLRGLADQAVSGGTGKAVKLKVKVKRAKGLRDRDVLAGGSDPFVIVEVGGQQAGQTETKDSHKNPVWDQLFDIEPKLGDSIKFSVYDEDPVASEPLGSATVDPKMYLTTGFDGWLPLKGTGALAGASLEVSIGVDKEWLAKEAGIGGQAAAAAPKFEYQSNDILATLQDLLMQFEKEKKDLDEEEMNANSAFEKTRLALATERDLAQKSRAQKESMVESHTDDIHEAKESRKTEEEDRDADNQFMKRLEGECRDQAELFDRRSKVRSDELTVLAKAAEELKKGAVPNYEGNRYLVGLQESATHKAGKKIESQSLSAGPVTLVQISSTQHRQASREDALQRVRSFLADAAERTESSALSAIAVRVAVSNAQKDSVDHFVKVRGLIKDLIQKLKDDAESEADQKSNCDKGMKKAMGDRDKAQAGIEELVGRTTSINAHINELKEDTQSTQEQIAELKKALNEATELSLQELADLNEHIRMCDEGGQSVQIALKMLEEFYSKSKSFLQTGRQLPALDRDGNDLADAPIHSTYHGAQHESEGIIGILEVILSDFERSEKQARSDKADLLADQAEFKKTTEADITKKNKRIKSNAVIIADQESLIIEKEQGLDDARRLHKSAMKSLEGWEELCVKGDETYEDRKKTREAEIAALKEAVEILDHWNGDPTGSSGSASDLPSV